MTPRKAPVGIVRAEAPRANATATHAPIALNGSTAVHGKPSWSVLQATAPRAAPAAMDVPKPPRARTPSDGLSARSDAWDCLNDIGCRDDRADDGSDSHRHDRWDLASRQDRIVAVANGDRGGHEPIEQRVRPFRAGLEFGVELARHEPWVVLELDDLDEPAVRRLAGQEHAGRLERRPVAVVDLES